jgi:tetracycline 7-halogenase / FADH2 O2-dependent halogenase
MAGNGNMGAADAGPSADPRRKYDVIILGSHLAGSTLATVLAANGVDVLLVDAPGDTLDPAGETTVPYTAEVFFTLARRFGVPELAGFGLTSELPAELRRASGIKRSIGFLYHEAGRAQDPRHAIQFNVPGEHAEWHPYRPQADLYARRLAQQRGASTIALRPVVTGATVETDRVHVTTSDGAQWQGRYVVDGSGPGSPLLAGLGAAAGRRALRSSSRLLATHMVGVRPFEDCADLKAYHRATPWSAGTVSHLFDGGWVQVVPFGNHPDGGNPLCGVTMSLDGAHVPLPGSPDDEFRQVVSRFPGMAAQFADAVPVRPWVTEDRAQHAVANPAGSRYFIFDRTASRNDLLLSRELTMAAEMVYALASQLIPAVKTDQWPLAPFERIGRFQRDLIDFNDRILAVTRISTRDFQLWNAFSRVWLLWSMLAAMSLKRVRADAAASGDWAATERFGDGAFWFPVPGGLPELVYEALAWGEDVGERRLSPQSAARRIFRSLRKAKFVPPLYGFGQPEDRYYHFSLLRRLRMLVWSRTGAPPEFRQMLTRENVTGARPGAAVAPAPAASYQRQR